MACQKKKITPGQILYKKTTPLQWGSLDFANTNNRSLCSRVGLYAKQCRFFVGVKFFLLPQTIRSLRLSKGLVCKAVPVLGRGEVFLLTQTIRTLRLSKGVCVLKRQRPFDRLRDRVVLLWNVFYARFKNRKAPGEPEAFFWLG